MATFLPCVSRPPPAALVATPALHILRPIHGARYIHLLGRRGPSFASLKMQAHRRRDPFRSNCAQRADNFREPEPEPEPESEPENHDSDKAPTSGNHPLVDKLLKSIEAARAESGIVVRKTPDMFITEKEHISSYKEKLNSSHRSMDGEEMVMPSNVFEMAQDAFDLASHVMDITGLRRRTIQFSQLTVDQMVRMSAAIFCNVAENAYYNKFNVETVLSFLGALRALGAIYHIVAQDTVVDLKDGRFKNSITYRMGQHSYEFNKAVQHYEDVTATVNIKPRQMTDVLYYGLVLANVYIDSLANCREAALNYLKD